MNTFLTYLDENGTEKKLVCDKTMRLKPIVGTNKGILTYYNIKEKEITIIDVKSM